MLRNIFTIILVSTMLSACYMNQHYAKSIANNPSINLIPMYGHPEIEKTESQKTLDKEFISSVVAESGSHEKSAIEFAAWGWAERRKNNLDVAMRRFNQSWLLDPNYYQPYWGFGTLILKENSTEASVYFEKALKLIDGDNKEKARLLVDTAKSYSLQGIEAEKTDTKKLEHFYNKANSLIEKALSTDPKYGKAYHYGALIYYEQADYRNAWKIVRMARASGNHKFDQKFIEALSSKMAEQK
jgi:tetratricopeptide (TPR) repeat protein